MLNNAKSYSTSSVSSAAADYQHLRRAVLAWAVGPCDLVLEGLKDSSRRYATYAVKLSKLEKNAEQHNFKDAEARAA